MHVAASTADQTALRRRFFCDVRGGPKS